MKLNIYKNQFIVFYIIVKFIFLDYIYSVLTKWIKCLENTFYKSIFLELREF